MIDTRTDAEKATRYLMKLWSESYTGVPPIELTQAVVQSVNAIGYTRNLVEKLFGSYRQKKATP